MAYRLISRSRYPIGNIEIYSGLSVVNKSLLTKGDSVETDKLTDRIRSLHNMDMISIVDLSVEGDKGDTTDEIPDIKIPEGIADQDDSVDENLASEEVASSNITQEDEVPVGGKANSDATESSNVEDNTYNDETVEVVSSTRKRKKTSTK